MYITKAQDIKNINSYHGRTYKIIPLKVTKDDIQTKLPKLVRDKKQTHIDTDLIHLYTKKTLNLVTYSIQH